MSLHQEAVAALAERRACDQRARGALGDREVGVPPGQRTRGGALERGEPEFPELVAALVDPGQVHARQQLLLEHCEHGLRRRQRRLAFATGERGLGAVHRFLGGLDVDPCRGAKLQTQFMPADQRVCAEGTAQLGDEWVETAARVRQRPPRPEGLDQLAPSHGSTAVEDEVGEQYPALSTRESLFDPGPRHLERQVPAQRDDRSVRCVQGGRSVLGEPRAEDHNRRAEHDSGRPAR